VTEEQLQPEPTEEQESETDAVQDEIVAESTDAGTEAAAIPSLEEQVAVAEAKAAEYLDGWQRARAELANFKKRTEREREQARAMLQAEIVIGLLPILDDFDLAMNSLTDDIAGHDWVGGIEQIRRKLQSQLAVTGLSEIEALGQPFDPELHEAVMQRSVPEAEAGSVVEIMRKGYRLGDRVIRPAMVVVAG
jgi:molecular chaperone GrpE